MLNLFFKKIPFGLDISDFSIEALELEKRFGKIYLRSYGRVELEKGIVEDGKILAKEKLKEKIRELLENTLPRKLKTNQAIVSLPESRTFFHIFELSQNLSGKKLVEVIKNEALKTIPLEPDILHFDFQIISKTNDLQEILFIGAQKDVVKEYLEVLKRAGLKPLVFDIESASLARAFMKEMPKDGGVLIVDVGARTTKLTVYDEDSIRLSAIVEVAGNHFTKAISEGLKVSLEKAEQLKRTCGFDPEKEEGRVMFILQNVFQPILSEIKESVTFYEKKSQRKIKKILLCGGSSFLPELPLYLNSNFDLLVQVPDPWLEIDVEELFREKELRKIIETKLHPVYFANVIGLAKRGLDKNPEKAGINLILN